MKLRNKKTGEIIDTEKCVFSGGGTKSILLGYTVYNSLAELCEEWEDYEKPKGFWIIESSGDIQYITDDMLYTEYVDGNDFMSCCKQVGNYFETEEEAEKAVKKLKAWKRLKDKGFKFEYYEYSDRDLHNHIQIKAITNNNVEDSMLYKDDLDLLFGGEE